MEHLVNHAASTETASLPSPPPAQPGAPPAGGAAGGGRVGDRRPVMVAPRGPLAANILQQQVASLPLRPSAAAQGGAGLDW